MQPTRRAVIRNLAVGGALAVAAPALAEGGPPVRRVATGFRFTEGPVVDAGGALYFTDIPSHRVLRLAPDGTVETLRRRSGGANGLALDAGGRLLACEGGRGRLTAFDPARPDDVTVIADQYGGRRFNAPNDLWVAPDGAVYFTDPDYGPPRALPQGGMHVYRVDPATSRVTRVVDDLVKPNGIAGTADGGTVYVADHGAGRVWAYTRGEDGALVDRRLFARERTDGMAVDRAGRVYLAAGAVVVYGPDPLAGRLRVVRIPEPPTNVALTPDERTLFVTARTSVYAVSTSAS